MRSLAFWRIVVCALATLWVVEHWIAPYVAMEGYGLLLVLWVLGLIVWSLFVSAIGGIPTIPKKTRDDGEGKPQPKKLQANINATDNASAAFANLSKAISNINGKD